jgi:monovalent cation/proton antiporter MnhG/PhaG subunit
MSAPLEIIASLFIVAGALTVAIAALGLIRLPDPFMRMHAATKAGVLGAGMVIFGIGLSFGTLGAVLTGVAGVAFLLATSPLASHALGRAAYVSGAPVAATNMADALAGVLPRNVFDIAPGRVTRPPGGRQPSPSSSSINGDRVMSAVEFRHHQAPQRNPAASSLRSLTAWLVGGQSQDAATAVALTLARAGGARVTGLSAMDPTSVDHNGPVPIGGMSWARWLTDQRRGRMRERAAKAIADFENACGQVDVAGAVRHEERDLAALIATAAGADLLVVPAGVDRIGEPAAYADEIAAQLSAAAVAPVLRVRRPVMSVRRVLIILSNSPQCRRLAQTLVRTGLWRDAAIRMLVVAEHRADVTLAASEQAMLLRAHGYAVTMLPAIDLDEEQDDLRHRINAADAVIMGVLTNRRGWFGAVREDVHEIAADHAGLILMP